MESGAGTIAILQHLVFSVRYGRALQQRCTLAIDNSRLCPALVVLRGADAGARGRDEARLTLQINCVTRSPHHLVEEAADALKRLVIFLLLSHVGLG